MIPVSREISDLKNEFEGGSSFSIDWYSILRRGAQNVIDNINPETLKRTVPIYGGITQNLQVYYCPEDVQVPSRIYMNNGGVPLDYTPPSRFYSRQNYQNKFTIEYVNNIRYLVIRQPISGRSITLDSMESMGTKVGVDLIENTYNVLPGARVSLEGIFNDSTNAVGDSLTQSIDISSVLNGVVIVPLYLDSVEDLEKIELVLQDGDGNSLAMTSNQDMIGDYLRDGQNFVRFWLPRAQKTGTPDTSNITSYLLTVKMKAGKSQTVILSKITIQQSSLFQFEYYSNFMFVDKLTGAWKDTPVQGDYLNLNRDAAGVFHYECARLVVQAATTDKANASESVRMDTELARKYQQYFKNHPSSEQPLSYNIMPEISLSPEFDMGIYGDLSEREGNYLHAEKTNAPVTFVDVETPTGAFNGVNKTFYLAHRPDPSESLVLTLNGQLLTGGGQDFTLAGQTITFTLIPDQQYSGLPFNAAYRYTI